MPIIQIRKFMASCDFPSCKKGTTVRPKDDTTFEQFKESLTNSGWDLSEPKVYCPRHARAMRAARGITNSLRKQRDLSSSTIDVLENMGIYSMEDLREELRKERARMEEKASIRAS